MTANLDALLSPNTIALVGASPDLHIFRGRTLKVMLGHRYAGRIYPVSRSHAEIQGLRAYPSVAAIPEPVDLAILIIPAEHVPDELERWGGAGGWLADACVAAGLTVPILDPPTRALLDERIPIYGSSQNPVDATAQAILAAGYGELTRLIAASREVDAVIMVVSARSAAGFEKEQDTLAAIAAASPKPILLWSYTLPSPDTTRILSQAGYPLFTSMQTCARALAVMGQYRAVRERPR